MDQGNDIDQGQHPVGNMMGLVDGILGNHAQDLTPEQQQQLGGFRNDLAQNRDYYHQNPDQMSNVLQGILGVAAPLIINALLGRGQAGGTMPGGVPGSGYQPGLAPGGGQSGGLEGLLGGLIGGQGGAGGAQSGGLEGLLGGLAGGGPGGAGGGQSGGLEGLLGGLIGGGPGGEQSGDLGDILGGLAGGNQPPDFGGNQGQQGRRDPLAPDAGPETTV